MLFPVREVTAATMTGLYLWVAPPTGFVEEAASECRSVMWAVSPQNHAETSAVVIWETLLGKHK